jgi:hypothetical protein
MQEEPKPGESGYDTYMSLSKFWEQLKPDKKASVVLQFLILLVTAAYACVAHMQWETMNRQLKLLENAERAQIAVTSLTPPKLEAGQTALNVEIKNIGRASVLDIKPVGSASVGIYAHRQKSAFIVQRLPPPDVLGPDQTSSFTVGFTLREDALPDIQSGKKAVWVAGRIDYSDVVGRRPVHRYCFVWLIRENTWRQCLMPLDEDPDVRLQRRLDQHRQ